jgi:hypothetical protein
MVGMRFLFRRRYEDGNDQGDGRRHEQSFRSERIRFNSIARSKCPQFIARAGRSTLIPRSAFWQLKNARVIDIFDLRAISAKSNAGKCTNIGDLYHLLTIIPPSNRHRAHEIPDICRLIYTLSSSKIIDIMIQHKQPSRSMARAGCSFIVHF